LPSNKVDHFECVHLIACGHFRSRDKDGGHTVRSPRGQDAQLSQRDRAAGCVIVFAKSRRLELGDNILRTL